MAETREDGCSFGCGFALAVLFILTLFGSCAKDIARNIEEGRQEAITKAERERMEMRKAQNSDVTPKQ